MSVELRQLKDAVTGLPFVPVTHWNAVSNKPNIDGSLNSINASLNALDASTIDIYNNLSNAEEVIATIISKLNYTIGFDSSANLVWSEESGLTTDTIKAAIEQLSMKSGVSINDSSVNVVETWSSQKISDELNNIDIETIQINDSSIDSSTVWSSQKVNNEIQAVKGLPYLKFTANTAGSTIALSNNGGNAPDIKYSRDGVNWTQWDYSAITLTNAGDYVYMKGDNSQGFSSSSSNSRFVMTGSIAGSGNIMSLIDNGNCQTLIIPCNYCFYYLFYGCTSLTSAPELPAITLANYCYCWMFYGCSSLTIAPELPAITLANYCYYSMFDNCTSLTVAPELPATTLASSCYWEMFYGCTSLTVAPELPATALAVGCYQDMFYGCTSLTVAPELPATTLAVGCYEGMFQNCTSLTSAPTELPATTLVRGCYYQMFQNCSNLNYIKCLATTGIDQNNSTTNWLSGVATTGTFIKYSNVTWPAGSNAMPIGWNYINLSDKQTYENGYIYDSAVNSIAEGVLNGTVVGIAVRQCEASGINSHAEGARTKASGNYSHAEGYSAKALDGGAHAEGAYTESSGSYALDSNNSKYGYSGAHAEGYSTVASAFAAHAEGDTTIASGYASHAEGKETEAIGNNSHASGCNTIASGNNSHAEGHNTYAIGRSSHAEGICTYAEEIASHSEGHYTSANSNYSHAEGSHTYANSESSHAEGLYTEADGQASHAEGHYTHTSSNYSHAEGSHTYTDGQSSHAEGHYTETYGDGSHAEGSGSVANGYYSHAEGDHTYANGDHSHAEGHRTISYGSHSHAEGSYTESSGMYSHAEGANTTATGNKSHSEGYYTNSIGKESHAEGGYTQAIGNHSHAEGWNTIARDSQSHAEGFFSETGAESNASHAEGAYTRALGHNSHTEGWYTMTGEYAANAHAEGGHTQATGARSHAEGSDTQAIGNHSHTEGQGTEARGKSSHAEGSYTNASGAASHAEGSFTESSGMYSHAEGYGTKASGIHSHTEGSYTITSNEAEHAEGKYNFSNTGTISSIGIGTSSTDRKNAFEVMDNGDTFIYGVGNYDGTNINATNTKDERLPASIQEVMPIYDKEKRSVCFQYNEADNSLNEAQSDYSFVIGYNNKAIREETDEGGLTLQSANTFVGGMDNRAYHSNCIVFGEGLFTQFGNTFVLGKYNGIVSNQDGWGDTVLGIVGDGYKDSNGVVTGRNVLLLQGGGDPALHCRGGFKNNASWINDFGEYFEWLDGNPDNEDRIGYMVQLNGDKIELATSLKKCIGVISGTTGFIGGVCAFEWHNKFLHDKWGREMIGEDGNPILNPDYNPDLEYIPRELRKEWDVVGLVGQVVTRQDGTLEVGGYAGCSNGIATHATSGFKVLKIIDSETALLLIK